MRETGLKEKHKGAIYGVYISSRHRRAGVGQALLADLLKRVKLDPTLEQIILAVSCSQTAARRLYRRFGFEPYGVEPHALKIGGQYIDEELLILRFS